MFYCNLEHVTKKLVKTKSGRVKKAATAKGRFHYITRTLGFEKHKENVHETLEFVRSGNMPSFAQANPEIFWQAADTYERSNGRICSSLVVAFPKELTVEQRIELAEVFIQEFADRYHYPFSCAIHNHAGALGGQEQPHLHLMYSERHDDGIERTADQFFKRYNRKEPQKGGAQKLTADVLGMGKGQLQLYRQKTEALINDSLKRHAPSKMLQIRGIAVQVPSFVSCLSNTDYNKKHGTDLKDVPIMLHKVRFAKAHQVDLVAERDRMTAEIKSIREENHYELYQMYYLNELSRRKTLDAAQKQKHEDEKRQKERDERLKYLKEELVRPVTEMADWCAKDDIRAEYNALLPAKSDREFFRELAVAKMQQLKEQMIQSLRAHVTAQSADVIREDFLKYVDAFKQTPLDRVSNLQIINELLSDLSHEVNGDPTHVLKDVQAVQAFLLQGQPLRDYQEVKPEVVAQLKQKREQDHGYDGPSF